MKRKITLMFILFYSCLLFSQKKVYLDEVLKPIDSTLHSKKCRSFFFACTSYTKDGTLFVVANFNYKIGKLTKEAHSQVLSVIKLQTKQKINTTTDNILIRFADTLFDYKTIKRKHEFHLKQYKPDPILINGKEIVFKEKVFNKTEYQKVVNNRNIKIEKCNKIYSKKGNLNFFYFYDHSIGDSKNLESNLWIKDKGLLKNFFFKKTNAYIFLILKPNGDYFLSDRNVTNRMIRKLLKHKNWEPYIADLKKTYEFKDRNRVGLFRITKPYYTSNCVDLNVKNID
jgi:hypothetical protein